MRRLLAVGILLGLGVLAPAFAQQTPAERYYQQSIALLEKEEAATDAELAKNARTLATLIELGFFGNDHTKLAMSNQADWRARLSLPPKPKTKTELLVEQFIKDLREIQEAKP